MDPSDELNISAICAYCGESLPFESDESDDEKEGGIELVIEWDHVCTTPPPIILTLLPEDEDE